jgi:excinuclease ABC subunit B
MPAAERERMLASLEKQMYEHARNLEFEQAGRLRDEINRVRELAYGPGLEASA